MSEKTLTRMDLSESVFKEVGLSRNESADLVESVLEKISASLVSGEQVKISSFGTFSIRQKMHELVEILKQAKKRLYLQEEFSHLGLLI